jgi:two-component system probable response regulator PhcQ
MSFMSQKEKFALLYVDDEEKSLKYFKEIFEQKFRIFTASNAKEGYQILEENSEVIGILMTDQRMPGETGTELLKKVRQLHPQILRFLVTAYTDIDAAIDAVNRGSIYKYISKPWDIPQLEITIRQGFELFSLQRERDQLLKEKLYVLQRMMISNRLVSLSTLTANFSHHIRNAMFSINAFLNYWIPQLLSEKNLDPEPLQDPEFWLELYPRVQAQTKKVSRLLDGLEEAFLEPVFEYSSQVKLHEVVSEAISNNRQGLDQREISVENNIPTSLPSLKVDKAKFDHLFDLFLKHEIKSLPQGGKVSFAARPLRQTMNGSSEIQVSIRDNGPTLSPSPVRCFTDPFKTPSRDPQELGFELMACFFVVYHHGGKIKAVNDKRQGASFSITLPTDPLALSHLHEDSTHFREMILDDPVW